MNHRTESQSKRGSTLHEQLPIVRISDGTNHTEILASIAFKPGEVSQYWQVANRSTVQSGVVIDKPEDVPFLGMAAILLKYPAGLAPRAAGPDDYDVPHSF